MSVIDLATYAFNLELNDKGFEGGLNKAEQSFDKFEGKMSGFSKFLTTTLVASIASAGAALGGFAVKGTKDFIDFEKQMNQVFTLLPGVTEDVMGDMTKQVKEFSKEFGALPEDVVPALYNAISAGVPKENVFDFLAVAQKAAIGGVSDTLTAVDGLTSVVNAYGSDVLNVGEASDLMFTAMRLGKTSFDEMAQSLYNVIPTASSLDVAFSDITAGLAALTAAGTPTSVATTQMRQMLVELSKEGTKTSDTFKNLAGMGFREFIAEGNNVQDALVLLEQHAKKSGIGINDLFGSVEAGNAALGLTGKGTELFTQALEDMANSAGATDAAFDTMEQGIGASFNKISSSIKVMLLDLGEKLAPAVSTLADYVLENIPKVQHIVESSFDVIGKVINTTVDIFNTLTNVFENTESYTNETFSSIKNIISDVIKTVQAIISDFIILAIDLWEKYGDDLIRFAKSAWENVSKIISGLLEAIRGIIKTVTSLIHGDWQGAWEGIKSIVSGIWKAIEGLIQQALNTILAIIQGAGVLLKNIGTTIFTMLWEGIKWVWNSMTTWISNEWNALLSNILGFGSRFYNAGADLFQSMWDGLKNVWSNIQSWVNDKINWITDKLAFWRSSNNEMNTSTVSSSSGNIPAYQQGTPYVPSDGLAFLHKGEMVVPKEYNPNAGGSKLKSTVNPSSNTIYLDSLIHIDNIAQANDADVDALMDRAFKSLRKYGVTIQTV